MSVRMIIWYFSAPHFCEKGIKKIN